MDSSRKRLSLCGVAIAVKGRVVVERADIGIAAGDILCVVGRNGSGKSTLLRVMAGLQKPTSGSIEADGLRVCGVWGGRGAVQPKLSARENIDYVGRLQGLSVADVRVRGRRLLERLELLNVTNKRAGELSSGLKMRLAIGMALVSNPDILFLDEPDSNLDAASLENVSSLLKQYATGGGSVVCASHEPRLVSDLATHVCRIGPDGAVACLTLAEFRHINQAACYQLELCRPAPSSVFSTCGTAVTAVSGREFLLADREADLARIMRAAAPYGVNYLRLITNPIERILAGGVQC